MGDSLEQHIHQSECSAMQLGSFGVNGLHARDRCHSLAHDACSGAV